MVSRSKPSGLNAVLRLLVTYRLLVYFGGLFVIGLPLLFRALGIGLSGTTRTVLVVVTLSVMVVTYIGERRVGYAHTDSRTETTAEEYPLKMRIMLALAVLGIAVGIYVTLEVNTFTGLLFIAGAYFFGYMGYRGGFDEGEQ